MTNPLPPPFSVLVGGRKTTVSFTHARMSLQDAPAGALFIFDANTKPLFPGDHPCALILPPGEEEKNFDSLRKILSAAVACGCSRDSVFYGIGGGVVGDMTAFAASIYMRGCGVKLVPTTLLSMVDASLGGKTGVDFEGYKNMAGSFYPAEELIICPDVLNTLPDREFLSGMAEVIKHALIEPSSWLDRLEQDREKILSRDKDILPAMIRDSLLVKARVVEEDFTEQGIRAHLNLGHTFGHALEKVSGFTGWSHGEGVAWGIVRALKAGVLMGVTSGAYAARVERLLESYGFRTGSSGFSPDLLLEAMEKDKKKRSGTVRFILQRGWGDTFQEEVPEQILRRVLS